MKNVLVVNGLWLPGQETGLLRRRLEKAGFRTQLFTYRSVADDLERNAARLREFIASLPDRELHLVGHSLGGILILRMLEEESSAVNSRVVCLGSPFAGSAAGKGLARLPGGAKLLGRSMAELLEKAPMRPWSGAQELGLIAGDLPLGFGRFICRLPKPHDGTVAVAETRLEGAKEHLVLPVSHLSMLCSRAVAAQVVSFLRTGQFLH